MQNAYCKNTHSKVSINFILTSWGPLSPTAITSSLESNNKSGIRHIILIWKWQALIEVAATVSLIVNENKLSDDRKPVGALLMTVIGFRS